MGMKKLKKWISKNKCATIKHRNKEKKSVILYNKINHFKKQTYLHELLIQNW
jgi:hypothetical protein